MGYKVTFYIKDREFKDKYYWTGLFRTEKEVLAFVKDNVRAGNTCEVVKSNRAEYMAQECVSAGYRAIK